jgi:hypothetical protein
MMGVNDERSNARRNQVIEDKRDERLLENRNERFREIFRQGTQPCAQPRAKDESLRNHLLL